MVDTHTHLDGEEFNDDLAETIQRAKDAGVEKVFLPAIDLKSCHTVMAVANNYPGYAYPMLGLHPEEVKADWKQQLSEIRSLLTSHLTLHTNIIAIGEVGLDYYWSREFEKEQLEAFEEQVQWSIETRLPLMIHCRKGQNEMVRMLRHYEKDLPGGVFHCFTGNEHEAEELLSFENFCLGIGGVLTFKKSNLPQTLSSLSTLHSSLIHRIVLETDSPYMAPVPHRGQRNESAFVALVLEKLSEVFNLPKEEVERITNENVKRIFPLAF